MKRVLAAVLCLAMGLSGTGCATILTGGRPDQKVRFASEPAGAAVVVDGKVVGVTPISVPLQRDMNHKVRMTLRGYPTYEKDLKTGFNVVVLGNILIGGVIGLAIDVISGATDGLNPGNLSVNFEELREEQAKASAALAK